MMNKMNEQWIGGGESPYSFIIEILIYSRGPLAYSEEIIRIYVAISLIISSSFC